MIKNLIHPLTEEDLDTLLDNMNTLNNKVNMRNKKNGNGKKVSSEYKKGTLERALEVFRVHQNGTGTPLSADNPRQLEHWNNGHRWPSSRTILFMNNSGVERASQSVHDMESKGLTAKQRVQNKEEGNKKCSETNMGQDQTHPVESTAIACFLQLCRTWKPEVFSEWEFGPVFDGLQADLMIRKKAWSDGRWVPIQVKSSQIQLGRQSIYFQEKHALKYNSVGIYCIAIGLREIGVDYKPTGPDDVNRNAAVYEVIDVGKCVQVTPSPAIHYSRKNKNIPPHCRCFMDDDLSEQWRFIYGWETTKEEYIKSFLTNLFNNIQEWPDEYRYSKEDLWFGRDTVNAECSSTHKIENEGIEAIYKALVSYDGSLRPPWRQGETVDSIITLPCGEELNISHKTARMNNYPYQRRFDLNVHPNDQFCDYVIASYAGQHSKVAVMERSTVYDPDLNTALTSFQWNENDLRDGVFIFDLENEKEKAEFFELLRVGADKFVKSHMGQKHSERQRCASEARMDEVVPIGPNKLGIKTISKAVNASGGTLQQTRRQRKTDDSTVTLACEKVQYARHKTATMNNNDPDKRFFNLGKRPDDGGCDYVIASYAGRPSKVAVMECSTVYDCGKKSFHWNENDLPDGVFIFDLENKEEEAEFIELLRVEAAAYVKNKERRQRQRDGQKQIDRQTLVTDKMMGELDL